jgi:hypothetical protein
LASVNTLEADKEKLKNGRSYSSRVRLTFLCFG